MSTNRNLPSSYSDNILTIEQTPVATVEQHPQQLNMNDRRRYDTIIQNIRNNAKNAPIPGGTKKRRKNRRKSQKRKRKHRR